MLTFEELCADELAKCDAGLHLLSTRARPADAKCVVCGCRVPCGVPFEWPTMRAVELHLFSVWSA